MPDGACTTWLCFLLRSIDPRISNRDFRVEIVDSIISSRKSRAEIVASKISTRHSRLELGDFDVEPQFQDPDFRLGVGISVLDG